MPEAAGFPSLPFFLPVFSITNTQIAIYENKFISSVLHDKGFSIAFSSTFY